MKVGAKSGCQRRYARSKKTLSRENRFPKVTFSLRGSELRGVAKLVPPEADVAAEGPVAQPAREPLLRLLLGLVLCLTAVEVLVLLLGEDPLLAHRLQHLGGGRRGRRRRIVGAGRRRRDRDGQEGGEPCARQGGSTRRTGGHALS
jgi:hypothetical protein